MRVLRAATLVFLVAMPLGAPRAFAASARATAQPAHQEAAERQGLLQHLRGFLVSLWSPEGCRLDPLGLNSCLPTTGNAAPRQPPIAAEGCALDPLGGCPARR